MRSERGACLPARSAYRSERSGEPGSGETGNLRPEVGGGKAAGFSLVEVTVAIGIFAFVVVGVLGLLPTALKMRAESAQETRAVLIATELFSSLQASGGASAGILRDGPGLTADENVSPPVDLRNETVMLGYPPQTTVPYFLWHSSRGMNPRQVWETGELRADAVANDIQTLALLSGEAVPGNPNLVRVTCQVRTPANMALANSRPTVFTTYVYTPTP
jgi:type II secretory pathway pseudopilin PulG